MTTHSYCSVSGFCRQLTAAVLVVAATAGRAAPAPLRPGVSDSSLGRYAFNEDWVRHEGLRFGQVLPKFIHATVYGHKWRLYYAVGDRAVARDAAWKEGGTGTWDLADENEAIAVPEYDPTKGVGSDANVVSVPGRRRVLQLNWVSAVADSGLGYTLRYSALAAAVVLESDAARLTLAGLPDFEYAAFVADGAVRCVPLQPGTVLHEAGGPELDANWLFLWSGSRTTAAATPDEVRDRLGNLVPLQGPAPVMPVLVVLQRRPERLSTTAAGQLNIEFPEKVGRVILGPVLGRRTWAPEAADAWAEHFPADLEQEIRFWSRAGLAFPIDCREEFRVDRDQDNVEIRNRFDYLVTDDEWGTEPLRLATLPDILVMAVQRTDYPVRIPDAARYLYCDARHGPVYGIADSNEISYQLPIPVIDDMLLPACKNPDAFATSTRVALNREKTRGLTRSIERFRNFLRDDRMDHWGVHNAYDKAFEYAFWLEPETEKLWDEKRRLSLEASLTPRGWRRHVDPVTGKGYATFRFRDFNIKWAEPVTLDGQEVPKYESSWTREPFTNGDWNAGTGLFFELTVNDVTAFPTPELLAVLREHWPFVRDETTSYLRRIQDWGWMASSNCNWGAHGVSHDMGTDEMQGYAAIRNAARAVDDMDTADFFTYLHAKGMVPFCARFAPAFRDWLADRGVPFYEDELVAAVGEYDWHMAEGEDVWCRMSTGKFMKEGYWDTNPWQRYGDGLLLDCGGNSSCLATLAQLAPETARTYAFDWFERWTGENWYHWKSGDLWALPTFFRTTPGMYLRRQAYETTRSNISRQLGLRMRLGWGPDRIWAAFKDSFHPDEWATLETDEFGPLSGGSRAQVLYAKLPAYVACWVPNRIENAVYDSEAATLVLDVTVPRAPGRIDLSVRQPPREVRCNNELLAAAAVRPPSQFPGYLRILIPAAGESRVSLQF